MATEVLKRHPLDKSDITCEQLEKDFEDWKQHNLIYDRNRDGVEDRFQSETQRDEEIDADGNGLIDSQETYFGNDRNGNGVRDDLEEEAEL